VIQGYFKDRKESLRAEAIPMTGNANEHRAAYDR
jgi:hypothetical protein